MTILGEATEQALRAQLEQDACCALPYTDGTLYAASTAISAKRQADALERIVERLSAMPDVVEVHSILEAAADPLGFGKYRNGTEFGLAAHALLKSIGKRP